MRHAILPLLALSAFCSNLAAADAPYRTAGERTVDIRHIKLQLDVSLKKQTVAGTATIDFAPRREIGVLRLDAVGHDVESVRVRHEPRAAQAPSGVGFSWTNTGEQIVIDFKDPVRPGSKRRVIVEYRVHDPEAGLYFFQPTEANPDVPLMVWSQGETIDNRHWFPCIDHPNERQTTEMIVTARQGFEVLSNGRLVSKKTLDDGRVRFHWKQDKPHVAYLVTLVVGRFAVGREEWRGRPVTYYAPPAREDDIEETFGRTKAMLDFFSDRFGIEYPWEKYAQVVVEQFIAGGMENTSATTLYSRVMHDKRALRGSSPDRLIAHELGHQWWGDLLTCKDWTHLWLNEGFATYSEVLWAEHRHGKDEGAWRLVKKSRSARSGTPEKRPIVDRHYKQPWAMFDSRAYPKGAWVLHMLRSRLGDEAFFRALQHYGTRHAYETVETGDFRQAVEESSGLVLERFFYDWTRRPGHPELTVRTTHQAEDKLVKIVVEQTQDADAFHFPFHVELTFKDRSPVTLEETVTEKKQTFFLPASERPQLVRIDPEYTLLADLEEKKSRDWWKTQLLDAPTIVERIRAVQHFGDSKRKKDRKLLERSLADDAFYGVRIEAAKALGKSGGDAARNALIAGLQEKHPKVRRACADALGKFEGDDKAMEALEKVVRDGDPSYFVIAAAVESLAEASEQPPVDLLASQLEKSSHGEVIRRAALKGLGHSGKSRALDILREWTKPGHPRVARIAAAGTIPDFVTRHETTTAQQTHVLETLTALLDGEGVRVRRAAVRALGDLGSTARPALDRIRTVAEHDPNGRVRGSADDAAEKILEKTPASEEVTRLRKELDEVSKQTEELQERLRELEADR